MMKSSDRLKQAVLQLRTTNNKFQIYIYINKKWVMGINMASASNKQLELWKQYADTKNPAIKEQLIIEYSNIVKYIAGRLSIYFGSNVEYDDLIGYGIFGLIDAIEKFDINKGVKFETYASLRIRGSIIDSIRSWIGFQDL